MYSPQPFAQPTNLTPSHFCSFPTTTPTITVQQTQAPFPHHSHHIAQHRPETISLSETLDHHNHHHPATTSPSIHITPIGHAAASAAAAAAAVQIAQMRAGPHIFLQADVSFFFVDSFFF